MVDTYVSRYEQLFSEQIQCPCRPEKPQLWYVIIPMDMEKDLIRETATSSRYLIKHVAEHDSDKNQQGMSVRENGSSSLDYTWQYMAFHSIWYHMDGASPDPP